MESTNWSVGFEHVVVEDEHQVEAGEIAADVADAALVVHPQQTQPGPSAELDPRSGRRLHGTCSTHRPLSMFGLLI